MTATSCLPFTLNEKSEKEKYCNYIYIFVVVVVVFGAIGVIACSEMHGRIFLTTSVYSFSSSSFVLRSFLFRLESMVLNRKEQSESHRNRCFGVIDIEVHISTCNVMYFHRNRI